MMSMSASDIRTATLNEAASLADEVAANAEKFAADHFGGNSVEFQRFVDGCLAVATRLRSAAGSRLPPPPKPRPMGLRRVIGSCIRVGGYRYGSSLLIDGSVVFVCVDPQRLGRALVFAADQTEWLCNAYCPELEAGQ